LADCGFTVGKEKALKHDQVTVNYQNGQMVVKNNTLEGKGELLIFNSKGQQVDFKKQIDLRGQTNKTVNQNLPSGMYIAKITLNKGSVFAKRFIVAK